MPIVGTFFCGTIGECDTFSRENAAILMPIRITDDPSLAPGYDDLSAEEVMHRYYDQRGVWYIVGLYGCDGDYYNDRPFNQNGG